MGKRDNKAGGKLGVGDLPAAASALDAAIRRYEDLVAHAGKIPLNSQKNLEKAAEAIQEAAAAQEHVGERLRGLADAIATTSTRQITAAEALQKRAHEIQVRTAGTNALLARFEALGRDAKEINALVLAAMPERGSEAAPERVRQTVRELEQVEGRMSEVVERATELARAAEASGLVDLARQADALRQQMLSSRNKVHLVRESFGA